MYQNLINNLKKILDSKSSQAEKLLKISTLVDFAEGLDATPRTPQASPQVPFQTEPFLQDPLKVTVQQQPKNLIDAKKPNGVGPLIGVEDIK